MNASELNKLKVEELQKLLKEKGLPSTGKKADLVQVHRPSRCSYILLHSECDIYEEFCLGGPIVPLCL